MMQNPSDAEIRKIVDEVVSRLMDASPKPAPPQAQAQAAPAPEAGRQVAIGADHGGFALK
jgi:hypothetical protein